MSRQTNAQLKGRDGSEVLVQDSHTDAPLLPIAGLERLHKIRPDRVDWVFVQTEIEASTRRAEQKRVNTLVFVERMAALVAAFLIGVTGLCGGIYAALQGHDWIGGIVATITIGTLAVAFLPRRG